MNSILPLPQTMEKIMALYSQKKNITKKKQNENIKYNKLKNSNNVLSRAAGVTVYVSQASTIRAAFVLLWSSK